MPTYIYRCEKHGEFEEMHSISTKLEKCPHCEAEGIESAAPERLIAATSFVLVDSGVGWYKNGYSSK
jgi:putative FmdB family regulatory protein